MKADEHTVAEAHNGITLAAYLRAIRPAISWSQARKIVAQRQVLLNQELCLDSVRRVQTGDRVGILAQSARLPQAFTDELVVRHLDDHVVVVEKPAGINTVRHPAEREWDLPRRQLSPTLEDRLQQVIAQNLRQPIRDLPRLRKVHRLDKLTSGLLVFARSAFAERELGKQFHKHSVIRRYLAVVPGRVPSQTIRTYLIRDRGDGRRGSSSVEGMGKVAITHIQVEEELPGYSLLSCRLETGRTHQIRIHLAEWGHPICGDPVYTMRKDGTVIPDASGAPRLALHAVELGFIHPVRQELLQWQMPLPADLRAFVDRLRI